MAAEVQARQVYTWIKSGTPAIVKEAESLLRGGKVGGVSKGALEKSKDKGFVEFVAKWKLPVSEGGGGGGGRKEGMLKTARTLFGEGTAGYKLAVDYIELRNKFADLLKKHNRTLSPGYIRGEKVEKAEEKKA